MGGPLATTATICVVVVGAIMDPFAMMVIPVPVATPLVPAAFPALVLWLPSTMMN